MESNPEVVVTETAQRRAVMKALASCVVVGGALIASPAQASFTQEPGSPFGVGLNPYGVVIGDFNADNRPDVVTVNGTASTVSVLLRQPAGGFVQETGSPITVGSGPDFGAVADFNGDARPDVAVANYAGSSVSVLLRQPGGGFAQEAGSPFSTPKAAAVAVADFNGDNRPDLAVPNYTGTVTILLRKAGGGFTAAPALAAGANPRNIATADFNADGRPDLAVTNLGSGNVTILLGKGGGAFEPEAGSPVAVGLNPAGVVASDLDGDGRPDLAVANFGSDSLSLLTRKAGGGFSSSNIDVGARPLGVATADFNRDGLLDLVITNNNGTSSSVTILLRTTGGGFVSDASSPVATANGAYGVGIADFNADGRPDLAVSNDGSSNVTILLNTTPMPVVPVAPVMKELVVVPTVAPPVPTPVVVAPKPPPVIKSRLAMSWTVDAGAVTINSATLHDVPGGATVRVVCRACRLKRTLVVRKSGSVALTALRAQRLHRADVFSVTITKHGSIGQVLSHTVRDYGRSDAAIRRAARSPFRLTRRCVPVGASVAAKRCR